MKALTIAILTLTFVVSIELVPRQPISDYRDVKTFEQIKSLETLGAVEKVEYSKVPTTCGDFYHIVKQYDWDARIMLAIMKAESGCNTNSVGDTWVISGLYAPSCGLLQIRTLEGRPSCEQLQDPKTNVEWAYRLFKANGYQPWSLYNNGAYRSYLE